MTQQLFPLLGGVQHYVWGGKDYLPQIVNLKKEADKTYAEWWLGTHNALPSFVELNGEKIPLHQLLHQQPQLLGEKSRRLFGDDLPFLLKILDVAAPLSIQLHPTKAQAEIGFAQENRAGIPLNASNRTYKDPNHKPEMMMALSDFWLLHGFKKKEAIIQSLNTHDSLKDLAKRLEKEELKAFYAHIMQADQMQLSAWLKPIIEKHQHDFATLPLTNPDYWVLYTIQAMNISLTQLDAGLLCFYLFNIVHLQQGEGIFQNAGIPHAYLRGQNIELMAASDNVIRGGLTPKFVNIPALLDVVDCSEVKPHILPAKEIGKFVHFFPHFVADFTLAHLALTPQQNHRLQTENAAILLIMQGETFVNTAHESHLLKQGEALFISADCHLEFESTKQGFAVLATLP